MTTRTFRRPAPGLLILSCALLLLLLLPGLLAPGEVSAAATAVVTVPAQNTATPTQTVIEFYKQLRQKHFREAFALSIYKPAIEGLSSEEFADLQSDFEKMANGVPENVQISGEQISGDTATVFVKVNSDEGAARADDSVMLMRKGSGWIIGDKENEAVVKRSGKDFFFTARIQTHHSEVQAMLQRISVAQLVYSQQHGGMFGNLQELINSGLVPKDLESTESTGYRFHVTASAAAKSFTAGAEPVRYNRTGRLSFFLDKTGIRSADNGGKPLSPPATK